MKELGRLALSQEWPDVWQDFLRDDFIHLEEGMTGNRQGRAPGLKAYVERHAGLEIALRTTSGYPTYFAAFAKRANPETEVERPDWGVAKTGSARRPGPAHDAERRVMLIRIPHFVEKDQTVVSHIVGPSVIRLMSFQGFDECTRHPSTDDRFREFVEGFAVGASRKRESVVPFQRSGDRSPDQIVKQGTQVMNEVRRDESETRRDRLKAGDLEDIAAALKVSATLRAVGLARGELADLNVEVIEMRFRSLQPPFKVVHAP